jgi:hypothetical protein
LERGGATLLPSALRLFPSFDDPVVLEPETCAFAGGGKSADVQNFLRVVKRYSVRSSGPRFSLKYTFVPRCPSDGSDPEPVVPDWVHPSLLEPDAPREEGIVVNGRVFPIDELHAYCTRGTINTIKYQAEDHAYDVPRVHVCLGQFKKLEESMMKSLLLAHVDHRLTVDACCVQGGAKWYRFTSQLHMKEEFGALKRAPRLFTTTGRGGLRAVYERLLRKHVLFYYKMARGVKQSAFRQMEVDDVGEMWDKYGAGDVASVRLVTKARAEKCAAPLPWSNVYYSERDAAKKALGAMPWSSSVMKPALLSKKSWTKQHTRANADKATCAGLSVPQIRNCTSPAQMLEETLHCLRYPFDRKPILITDAQERVANPQDYEGVIYLHPGNKGSKVMRAQRCVMVGVGSCDARHAALLVQWFPLLFEHVKPSETHVHPRTRERALYYSAKCNEKARAFAAQMEDEQGVDRQVAKREMKTFERLAAEYDALTRFTYPGCHAGCDE